MRESENREDENPGIKIKMKSLQKALEVLNCFIEKQPLGVTEIGGMLGLYKSNVHNILSTFEAMGYLTQDKETGKYWLGGNLFALCHAMGDRFTVSSLALPYMQAIVDQLHEVVYLTVPYGDEVVYLDAVYPAGRMRPISSLLGIKAKMYCTAAGKAMLSRMTEEVMEGYIGRELIPFTPNTIVDREALRREIALTRERGYAYDDMELEVGLSCVGVPLVNRKGRLEGAISVSGPSLRLKREKVPEIAEVMKKYAKEIEGKI